MTLGMAGLWFAAGLAALIVGAEALVRGASRLATLLRISPLVIGLTVVAFGTSSPELAVSIKSALAGQTSIALGNVIGSNIFNVLAILGVSALVVPLVVSRQLIRFDVPLLIVVSAAVLALAWDRRIGRFDGVLLTAGLVGYIWFTVRQSRRESGAQREGGAGLEGEAQREDQSQREAESRRESGGHRESEAGPASEDRRESEGRRESEAGPKAPRAELGASQTGPKAPRAELGASQTGATKLPLDIALIVVGLLLLGFGSRWLVDAAVLFARAFGISELVVGLTIVAVGTSLPEAVTSVVAALRGERDIAVGNVVGSNIFNLLGVLGIAALVAPNGIAIAPAVLRFDLPVMIVVAVACLPIFFTGGRISRWEGALFVGYFLAYVAYLILSTSRHDALEEFNAVMLYFVVPLTVVTLIVVTVRSWLGRSPSGSDESGAAGSGL